MPIIYQDMKRPLYYKFIGSTTALLTALVLYFSSPFIKSYMHDSNLYSSIIPTQNSQYKNVPIFLFHNLDGEGKYSITRHEFKNYLEIIQEEGYEVISLKTLMSHARSGRAFEKPSCVITIDDDFKNIVRVAAPLLREFSYPATLFVYISDINPHPRGGLSWEDLDRLRDEGFEIQNHSFSHTKFHKPFAGETEHTFYARIQKEIHFSKTVLEEHFGKNTIYAFAYPMGYKSEILESKLKELGYELLLTTDARTVNVTSPFVGSFDRYTIQHLERGDYRKTFKSILIKAKNTATHENNLIQQNQLSGE